MASNIKSSIYYMGHRTYPVPNNIHINNRTRLCDELKQKIIPQKSMVFLEGGKDVPRYCTDTNMCVFRQESYFHWTFGVLDPDCFGVIDIDSEKTILFVPRLPESYAIWMGKILSLDEFKTKYFADEAYYVDEMYEKIKEIGPSLLVTLKGLNTDSERETKEANFKGISQFKVDNKILHGVISELRVFKTDAELEILRYVNDVSSEAHREIMKLIKPGMYEYQCESIFLYHCYRYGAIRMPGYTCICGSGNNGSVLHYGHASAPNSKKIHDGDMCLFDLGGEYYGYVADITCSFPVDGKFTDKQKLIYNAVLDANRAVIKAAKPGVMWPNMHRLSERVLLAKLKEGGLVSGDVDEMMKEHVAAIFYPHGLGHLMGLDVHDVGGYPEGILRSSEPGLKNLRTGRMLKERMVITVEPGCYFIDALLDPAFKNEKISKFLIKEKIDEFRGFGGVRIEDNIIITKDGNELLTKVPRTVEEIEQFMNA